MTEPPPQRRSESVLSVCSAATRALAFAVYDCSHTRTSRIVTTGWSANRSVSADSSAFWDSAFSGGGGSGAAAAPDATVALVAAEACLQYGGSVSHGRGGGAMSMVSPRRAGDQ